MRTRRRRGSAAAGACVAALLGSAVPASANVVPLSRTGRATPVVASPVRSGRPLRLPLLVRDPAQYQEAKRAANAAYAGWVARHPISSVFGPLTSIPNVSKPGLNVAAATADGQFKTPPDPTGAIGPNYYLEFVNSAIAVYNRNTLGSPPVSAVTENTFVKSSFTCDGQIKWDNLAQRWLYYSLDCGAGPGNNGNGFSFGFSKSANPLPLSGSSSAWCNYHVNSGTTLEDYGKLGNSNDYMIIGTNEYAQSNGNYTDSAVWVLPKPKNGTKVSTCPTENYWSWTAPTMYTPEPANIVGSSNNGFVVGLYLNAADDTHLRQYVLTPPASGTTSPVLKDLGNIAVPKMDTPASVPQPGSSDPLDSGDTRLTQANAAVDPALKTFGVWTQNTVAGASGGPSVVRWYEIKGGIAQTSPVQTGTVSVPGAFAFNGAIAPDAHGDGAAIEYNVGSATQKVQVRARIHAPGSAAASTVNETTLATSTGIDDDFLCPSRDSGRSSSCRWGDYAGASSDPICQGQVYGTNELYGPASSNPATWETQNFRLVVDECPTASFIVTTSSPTHGHPVGFDGSGSKDPDGSIVSYTWKFGDGTSPVTTTTPTTTHTFGAVNTYQVNLTVKDSSGLTWTTTKSVTVS